MQHVQDNNTHISAVCTKLITTIKFKKLDNASRVYLE